ncbi:MAG: cadherin-like beta sandwich domain-containing protein, partial [Gammaproteobacteria bacterium]|nr:cadherin-like beta sandwich domain-containing protein [Gammaproteobacteria bacterium]
SLLFGVTLNRAATYRIVVNYHTEDITAQAGLDYVGVLESWGYALIFEPGETRKVVRVPVIDDTIEDSGETLKLVLTNPQGAALRDPEGIGTILNDDPPPGAAPTDTGDAPTDTGDTNTDTDTGNTDNGGNTDTGNSNTDTNTGGSTNTGNSNTDTNTGNTDTNTNTGGGTPTNTGGNTNTGNSNTNTGNSNTNTGGGGGCSSGSGGGTSAPSGDAALSGLSVLGNDKRLTALDPAFDPDTTGYASAVPHAVSAVRLIPTRRDRDATVSVGGQPLARGAEADFIALDVGRNVIAVVMTAADGTTRTYTVTLTRAPAPAPDPTLPALVVTGEDDADVTLSPAFDPETTDYEVSLAHDVSAVTLTPAAPHGPARITVAGAPVAPGRDSAPVPLNVGGNPVEVVVSHADGSAARTYTVTLHRAAAPPPPVADRRALPDLARALADDTQDSIATRLETGRRGGAPSAATPTLTRLGQALSQVLPGQSLRTPAPAAFDPIRADARVDSGWVQPTAPVNWQALIDNADFVLPLNATPADGDPPTGLDSLTLWSDGSYRQLRGHSDGLHWDGDLLGARLGAELRLSPSLTAGTAAGWQRAGWDETNPGGNDRHTLTLINVNPYAGWTGGRLDAWLSGGLGWGEIDSRRDEATHKEDVTTRTVSGGLNTRLWETAALTLKLKAEGLLTGLATESLSTHAHRLRLGLEAGHTRPLGQAGTLAPTLQLGLRHDGGDGPGGTGLELGGAVHYRGGPLTLHGQGRTLIGRDGYKEWGVQGTAEWRARLDGRGLVFSLSPGVGYGNSGIEQLWTRGLRADTTRQAPRDYSARLDLRLDYGWDAPHHRGRLTPYLGVQLQHTARYRVGTRWAAPGNLQLHLLGERTDGQAGRDAEHALLLEGTLGF